MLKRLFLLLGVLCIHKICGLEESVPKAGDEPKLDNEPHGVADAIKTTKDLIEDDDYDDGVRPISFDPIPPKGPQNVVPPPVEHGSFQAGLDPEPHGLGGPPPPPSAGRPPAAGTPPAAGRPPAAAAPSQVDAPPSPPTVCDGAILACCHRQEVTYDCFANEGCGELEYENPCDAKVLLNIVNKFRTHFKARG